MTLLTVAAQPGTERWAMKPEDADLLGRYLRHDVRLEYWPRKRIDEVWFRDKHHTSEEGQKEMEKRGLSFRGYSFADHSGHVAVIVVDDLENYKSSLFVVLHEVAHLHAPKYFEELDSVPGDINEEEDRADEVAAKMMPLFGHKEMVYEASYWDPEKLKRMANPGFPKRCCPNCMVG